EHRHPPQDHDGVHRVQGAQLHHPEEPAQRPGPDGAQEVLPALPQAPAAPRDALTFAPPASATLRRPLRRPASAPQVRVVSLVASPPCLRRRSTPASPGATSTRPCPTP